jgi:hypothetical protein
MRCVGIVINRRFTWPLRRCGSEAQFACYCFRHWWQPLTGIVFILITVIPAWITLADALEKTRASQFALITRVSLDIHQSNGVDLVYLKQDEKRREVEEARCHIPNLDGKAACEFADVWREQVKNNLPADCTFDPHVTLTVNRPWHRADHGNRSRCSWSCQYEGKGPGALDKVCRTGETYTQ